MALPLIPALPPRQKKSGPVVKKTAPAATIYREAGIRRSLDRWEEEGQMGVSEAVGPLCNKTSLSKAKQGCLLQSKLVCCEVGLSVAKWAYPRQSRLIQGKTNLSTAKQPYPGQNKVIHSKTSLSTPNQGYSRQNNLIWRRVSLSATKWTCLLQHKVRLQQIGLQRDRQGRSAAGTATDRQAGS